MCSDAVFLVFMLMFICVYFPKIKLQDPQFEVQRLIFLCSLLVKT
jgi:hypothetical protein